ncbi:hypothetical protein C1631_022450 [Chryseobacterium phosphatilyticum]|uniref:Secretion system C-terminal sorting domain-containing protein n=1 Tax=Chryseobacterium phosphatilyticum TaxID=475075 RepID=A0A316WWQ4_9FLAO|nr:T9SS type A sorting domain-containing protein [Chryseobacterium phosphatilyticum]PWN63050.1 hypothetical protein C1631_022450 [Chryseobacterium phosphatilyticum]
MKYFLSVLFGVSLMNAQTQPVIENIPSNYNSSVVVTNSAIQNVIGLSETFRGQAKLTSIDPANGYQPQYTNGNWPLGSWFRGYFSGFEYQPNPNINGYKMFYESDPAIPSYLAPYWSSHPQPRDTGKQIRALIHFDNYFGNSSNSNTVVTGLEYLINQIQPNGGYIYWWTRGESQPGNAQTSFEQDDNVQKQGAYNRILIYETGSALAALCEGYLYLKKNNIAVPEDLYKTIVASAEHIYIKPINDDLDHPTVPDYSSSYYNADYNSINYVAFGLWGLSKAYKITGDCRYLEKIEELGKWLVSRQHKENDLCNGTWNEGEGKLDGTNILVNHETKIVYHAITLRALIDALDCIPKSDRVLREKLASSIKKAANHIIKYRVDYQAGGSFGATSYLHTDKNCTPLVNPNYGYYYSDDIVECIALLAYYSRFATDDFNSEETRNLRQLLNIVASSTGNWIDPNTHTTIIDPVQKKYRSVIYMPSLAFYLDYNKAMDNNTKVFEVDNTNFFDSEKTSKPVSLDFDHDGVRDEVAYFSTNGDKTFLNVAKMASDGSISSVKSVWKSTGYPLELFSDRIVSGDFDSDGYFDDIAVMCDYGGGETRIHVFEGTGSEFIYSNQDQGWWKEMGYYANLVGDRMVSGDFDGDGNHNDVAVFYRYDSNKTIIHVFQGQANKSFKHLTANGWWQSNNYSTDNIIGNIVSGNFDNNGIHDDIAVFYKNSDEATAVHVFERVGSSFVFKKWWENTGYPFSQFTKRIVSGNFYDGNKRDDIAVLYESDPGHTNLHLFQGKGDHFNYLGSTGYWASTKYDSKKIKGKIVDFNIGNDTKSQIFAMYNVPGKDSKLQVFKNNMDSSPPNFALNEVKDWWKNECDGDINLQSQYVPSGVGRMVNRTLENNTSDKIADIKIYKDSGSYEVVSQEKIKSIQIFDFSGKMIQEYTGILSNRYKFNIVNKGNYIVKVSDINNKISTKKILD